MRIIGLTGRAQAGKSTVARLIAEELEGQSVTVEAFADRLKVSAARALGFEGTPQDCVAFCDRLKLRGMVGAAIEDGDYVIASGRQFLQRYGTEAHRDLFGADFWTDAVLPADGSRHDADVLVVSDVRFPNEAERILDLGGEVWEVSRPGGPDVGAGHVSEAGIPSALIDLVLLNGGTVDELRLVVRRALAPRGRGAFVVGVAS